MKDYLFYPLCALSAVVMFGVAMYPGLNQLPDSPMVGDGTYEGYFSLIMAGEDLNRIKAGGPVEIELLKDDVPWVLRIGHEFGQAGNSYNETAYFPLGPDFEVQYGDVDLTISLDMAATEDWGASAVEVMYATGMQENSGWQRFDLSPEMTTYAFTYRPPTWNGINALDYLAVRPVVDSKKGFILLERVHFTKEK